jgi:hypothetical protein
MAAQRTQYNDSFDETNYGSFRLNPKNKKPGCIGALCKSASKKMGKIKACVGKACTRKRRKGSIQNPESVGQDSFGYNSSDYGTLGGKRRRRKRTRKKKRKFRGKKGGKRSRRKRKKRKKKTKRRRRR